MLTLDVEPVEVTVDTAVPCGLALNELVTNALKHGRAADGSCTLTVSLRRESDHVLLTVADRGPGFPEAAAVSGSLGMQLLRSLARQVSGKLEFGRHEGASVTLRMRQPPHKPSPV